MIRTICFVAFLKMSWWWNFTSTFSYLLLPRKPLFFFWWWWRGTYNSSISPAPRHNLPSSPTSSNKISISPREVSFSVMLGTRSPRTLERAQVTENAATNACASLSPMQKEGGSICPAKWLFTCWSLWGAILSSVHIRLWRNEKIHSVPSPHPIGSYFTKRTPCVINTK